MGSSTPRTRDEQTSAHSSAHVFGPRATAQIAYDVVLVLLPATLLGSTAGVFLNKMCPNWLIMLLLVLLCGYSGKRTLSKGFQTWEKESREQSSCVTPGRSTAPQTGGAARPVRCD